MCVLEGGYIEDRQTDRQADNNNSLTCNNTFTCNSPVFGCILSFLPFSAFFLNFISVVSASLKCRLVMFFQAIESD